MFSSNEACWAEFMAKLQIMLSRMPTDAVMVALIDEALNASTHARRIAARLLLDVLRAWPTAEGSKRQLDKLEAAETMAVANELRALIEQYGLR